MVVLNDESDGDREGHQSGDEEENLSDVTEGKIDAPVKWHEAVESSGQNVNRDWEKEDGY